MKINIDEIKNNVVPRLNNSINYLEQAINSIAACSIPEYFNYEEYMYKLPNNIRYIKNDVNVVKSWAENVVIKFQSAEQKNNGFVSGLSSKLGDISSIGTGATTGTISVNNMSLNQKDGSFFSKGFEIVQNIASNISNGINNVAAVVTSMWNSLFGKMTQPGIDLFEACKAKVSNIVTSAINEVAKGINSFKEGIINFAKAGWSKACEIKQSIDKAFSEVGAKISEDWNFYWTEVWPTVWDGLQATGASLFNILIMAPTKGICQFVEAIVDFVFLLGTAAGSIGTGIYDGISYLVSMANGTTDEWSSATGAMWEWTMGFVAEDWVGDACNWIYQTEFGKWLDDHAWDWAKSNGIGFNIASGIGYVAGIIILTIVTMGIGGAAVGGTAAASSAATSTFATTSAAIAASAATGKYTQEAWGKMRDESWEGIERMYERGEITEEDYNTMYTIKFCSEEQWNEIEEEYKAGIISEEQYKAMKEIRERPEDWKTTENLFKGLGYGVANGLWEGIQWYIGGKLAGWAIKGSKIATSAVRVGTDTAFNGLDTPVRTAMDVFTYGKTWDEAWEEQGGWQSVATNIGIGLIGSAGGEAFDAIKLNKASKILDNNEIFDDLDEVTTRDIKKLLLQDQQSGKIDISKMTKEELENEVFNKITKSGNKKVFKNAQEVSEFFSDPKGFLADKIDEKSIMNMNDTELYEYALNNLKKKDFKKFKELFENRRIYTEEQSALIQVFAKAGGPAIEAKARGVNVEFKGYTFNGDSYMEMNRYFQRCVNEYGFTKELGNINIDDAIKMLDNIIESSPPLEEAIVVNRNVDSIFYKGDRILNPEIGMIFDDKAFLSTSAVGGVFNDRKIKLEIEVPKGTKVAYIQSEAVDILSSYAQQEVLLGRNNMYHITDVRYDSDIGQYVIKAKILENKSTLSSIIDNNIMPSSDIKYYTNYFGNTNVKQVNLTDVINEMDSKGLIAQYEAEVRDMKMSGIYKNTISGHGEEHIEDVMFNAMYIAERENFDYTEKKLLMEAAKYHDAGKAVEGHLHGIQGAQNALDYLSNYSDDDLAIIQAAIEYHAINDDKEMLLEIFKKYNVADADTEMAERIANALKDADALDRSRYPGNINIDYLRTDSAKSYVMAAHQLKEIKGKKFLDNYFTRDIGGADRELIQKLRKSALSDYEIAFWIQYQPSQVGETIGAWQSINNKIQKILEQGG